MAAGAPNALLGWTGSTPDIDTFLNGFVALSQGAFDTAKLRPLKTYLLSLTVSLSLADLVSEILGNEAVVKLKWPNLWRNFLLKRPILGWPFIIGSV